MPEEALANPSPALTNPDTGTNLTNWSGNYRYHTDRLYQAHTPEQAQALVKKHTRLKVLGTRHCFNGIADSEDNLVSLGPMNQVIALDARAQTVTVAGGINYGQLCPYLASKGFALHNLASLPHISVAGACATASHGSGVKNGNLATAVSALEIMTADGERRRLSRGDDGETFNGAVVNLGALGVVTQVTLDVQLTFQMRQVVYEHLPMEHLAANFDAIMASGYSVSLFTDWQHGRIREVWVKSRVGDEPIPSEDTTTDFYGAVPAAINLHPIAGVSAENCTEQRGVPGVWYDRLPHFRMGFTPSSGRELQSEYFVPYRNAVEAILAVERLRDQLGPHLMVSEIRTIAADTLWLSPCYQQASVALHFTWKPDWPAVRQVLPLLERELAPFNPRPHWGKLFTMNPAVLQARYEKLPDFVALASACDPGGKFRNAFLNANVFAGKV